MMLFLKILLLLLLLFIFIAAGFFLLRRHIVNYKPLTWALTETFWYLVSFGALCIGLIELERMERMNHYMQKEKAIMEEYFGKRNLLHAQTWLLNLDREKQENEKDGVLWFHKMRSFFDEGIYSRRWEGFLNFSSSYVSGKKIKDLRSHSLEYGWPLNDSTDNRQLFLQSEITWMVDSLNKFNQRKSAVERMRPVENTNYILRYFLIVFFLMALALKFLKIYADYMRNLNSR